jgi:signal transduction histidine kinase/CheY-like chemotaxis protein
MGRASLAPWSSRLQAWALLGEPMSHAVAEDIDTLRRRATGLGMLVEASGALAATLDLGAVLQASTDGVCRLAGFDTAAVYVVDGERLRLGATTPALPPGFPDALRLAALADHPHIRRALLAGAPLLLPDAQAALLTDAERTAAEQRGLRTILYLPMIAGVKPVGVLIVAASGAPRPLASDEVDLCRTLANLAALATENARLYQSGQDRAAELARQSDGARRANAERLELERRLLHAQKLESLGILAGGIAHDFNNLLQAMLGNLDLAVLDLVPGSEALESVERAAVAAKRASDLTRQLLAYSGKGRFVVRPLDLSAMVRECAHLLRASVPHTCGIQLQLADGLPAVEVDAGQAQQVVMNLITNAADAIGPGPGTITVTTARREGGPGALAGSRIAGVEPTEAYVAVEVADTGCGMEPATVERMFDPFFSTKGVGRGLGMSALLGIVRGHGGALFVDSAPGRGTTVRALFPVQRARASPPAPAAEPPDAAPTGARPAPAVGAVLVVDDEDLVRRACVGMVRSLKRTVLAAAGGLEAVELLQAHRGEIRVAVVDLSMPGMDGLATLDALLAVDPTLRVILSSGFDEQALLGREGASRVAGFIQKPYTLAALQAALARVSAGRGAGKGG